MTRRTVLVPQSPPLRGLATAAPAAPASATHTKTLLVQEVQRLWVHAWSNAVAGAKCMPKCISIVDDVGQMASVLAIATINKRLHVYSGMDLISTQPLLGQPSSLQAFVVDDHGRSTMMLAAASGGFVYIYRRMRPYFKFSVPLLPLDPAEASIWQSLRSEDITVMQAAVALQKLQGEYTLSDTAQQWIGSSRGQREVLAATVAQYGVQRRDSVCTMAAIPYMDHAGSGSVQCLVVGTESGAVYILKTAGNAVLHTIQLPTAPVAIATQGFLSGTFRIAVVARDGQVYFTHNATLLPLRVALSSPATNVVLSTSWQPAVAVSRKGQLPCFVVSAQGGLLVGISTQGQQLWSVHAPAPITAMAALQGSADSGTFSDNAAVAVGCQNGEVCVYVGPVRVSSFMLPEPVAALQAGPYARERCALVAVSAQGSMHLQFLRREMKFSQAARIAHETVELYSHQGADPEVAARVVAEAAAAPTSAAAKHPLSLGPELVEVFPKKTRAFVELAERERQQAELMHHVYQRGLVKLKLATVNQYRSAVLRGDAVPVHDPVSKDRRPALRLVCELAGLGPKWALRCVLTHLSGPKPTRIHLVLSSQQCKGLTISPTVHTFSAIVPAVAAEATFYVTASLEDYKSGTLVAIAWQGTPHSYGSSTASECPVPLAKAQVQLPAAASIPDLDL